MELLAEADEHLRNLNFDRAGSLTRPAEAGGVRQMMVGRQTVAEWCEHSTDRAGMDAAIGMAADAAINRAGIQASAAADAKQAFAQRAAENSRAAVIENDEVECFRPVQLAGLPRAGDDLRINRELLAGCSAGEDLQEVRQVGQARDDLLDAHDGDVALGKSTGEEAVPFVGDQYNRAGFGDREIRSGNADV